MHVIPQPAAFVIAIFIKIIRAEAPTDNRIIVTPYSDKIRL